MDKRPLAGLQVLDLTNVLAGPYCSYQLMLLGATVTKVEMPGRGDLARQLGVDEELNQALLGVSFLAQNAGKKSVELDLKAVDDRELFTGLLRDADVLLENFRPGVLARLGFDWPRLQEINPGLIYCAISGFGQTGPMSGQPAYDQIIQGLSGIMSVTGTEATAPMRAGFPVCDTLGGLAAACAVSAAIAGRHETGRGCMIDVSMLEVAISAMGWVVSNYLISGIQPRPMANENATAAPSGMFETSDGKLNIAANQEDQFRALCICLGRDDLLSDIRFASRSARKHNREALSGELTAVLRTRSAAEWEQMLTAAGVPAGQVLNVSEVVRLEQLQHRHFFNDLPFPDGSARTLRVTGSGVLIDGEPLHALSPPPLLGQDGARLGRTDSGVETYAGGMATDEGSARS
jgi:crotonobetainyl-CoA:carnitine CoA-transferase CaiB-like acyl-CoA transferase